MSHTPGPWSARLNTFSRWEILDARGVLAHISRDDDPASPPPITEIAANACLIAAAPVLLAALEEINLMACYASEEDIDSREAMLLRIGELARAAIALAEPVAEGGQRVQGCSHGADMVCPRCEPDMDHIIP